MVGNDHGNDHSGGSLAEQLRAQMRALVGAFATTRGRQIALTLAASDPESEMTRAFRNRVILSSRERGRELIDEAVRAGVIKPPVDPEVLLDMLYAPSSIAFCSGTCHSVRALPTAWSTLRSFWSRRPARQGTGVAIPALPTLKRGRHFTRIRRS